MRPLILAIALSFNCAYALAAECSPQDQASIKAFMDAYRSAWNRHAVGGIADHYANDYKNSDGLDKEKILEVVRAFFANFPDATVSDTVSDVSVKGDDATLRRAAVQVAHSSSPGMVGKEPGMLNSNAEAIWKLRRKGSSWKLVGEERVSEETVIAFGAGKDLAGTLTISPSSVKAGSNYNATYELKPTTETLMGAITNRLVTDTSEPGNDAWRAVRNHRLSRELVANSEGHDERVEVMVAMLNPGTRDQGGGSMVGMRHVMKLVKVSKE